MPAKHVHMIGIGGISMSAIAEYLIRKNHRVSGSDIKESEALERLRDLGAAVYVGHNSNNLNGAEEVVVSSAIPPDNPELKAAKARDLPVFSRAQMLARLMRDKYTIAVSGTHGKTTTTSMIAEIINREKFDPTIMVGAQLTSINGTLHMGEGDYFLTEADESDGSLLEFDPRIAVITNIDWDHMDFYEEKSRLLSTFRKFIDKVPESGKIVYWCQDENIQKIIEKNDDRNLSYGLNKGQLQASDARLFPFGSYFTVKNKGRELGEINLQVPGAHNILNALAAIACGMFLGLSFSEVKSSIQKFSGASRRFDKKGLMNDILVVDDYAHHPTEIKATLETAANTGYDRIIAVFQPHRYSRTKLLMDKFAEAFTGVDHLITTEIYSAGESPIPGVTGKNLADKIKASEKFPVEYIESREDIIARVKEILEPRDLLITIGAGDIYRVGEELIEDFQHRHDRRYEE